jgi:hypothetical protein
MDAERMDKLLVKEKLAMGRISLLISLLFWGSSAFSTAITNDKIVDVITGADMAGMHVYALFDNGANDNGRWRPLTRVDLPFLEGEGMSGAAFGGNKPWVLHQQGYTLGNVSEINGRLLGAWTLYNNTGVGMSALFIDAIVGDIVFDTVFGDPESAGGVGRPFTPFPDSPGVNAFYTRPMYDGLYGGLVLRFDESLSGDGGMLKFWADTDKISSIPEPSTLLLLGVGLIGMLVRYKV